MKKIEVSREFLEEFEVVRANRFLINALIDVESSSTYKKLDEYLFSGSSTRSNNRILEFAEVWAGKAEYVAKEQLYYIGLPLPKRNSHLYGSLYLAIESNGSFTHSYAIPHVTWGWKFKFTEQEIKAIDERYWAFAVPVEEDNG